jgi:hypothetical protein
MGETSGSFRLASKRMFSASRTTSESELIFATGHHGAHAHGPGGRLLLQMVDASVASPWRGVPFQERQPLADIDCLFRPLLGDNIAI